MSDGPVSPSFSVIIPVLNEASGIQGFLQHLQTLRRSHVELIVVDGGSNDATPLQVGVLADKLIHSGRGRAVQMNAGARNSKGDFLLFLHADTWLPDGFALEQICSRLGNGADWGFCSVRLSGDAWYFRVIERLMNWRSALTGIGTGDQVLVVDRQLFFNCGCFPEIPLMEDIALSEILRKTAGRPKKLDTTVVTSSRRWERDGVVKTVLLMWKLRLLYYLGISPEVLYGKYYR